MARRPKIKSLELRAKVGKVRPEPVTPPLHPDLFRPKRRMRMPRPNFSLANRFFRYFTLFLVFLVLFAVVSGAEYDAYKTAVNGLYSFTETVGEIGQKALSFTLKTISFINGDESLFDREDAGKTATVRVKINKVWYEFECKGVYNGEGPELFNKPDWEVVKAPEKYADWVGGYFKKTVIFWWILPNGDIKTIINVKVENIQEVE